jgi:hypothetical protein
MVPSAGIVGCPARAKCDFACSAQKWWAMDGAKQRYAEMLAANQETPLFLNLVWTDYTRMATEIAAARVARR